MWHKLIRTFSLKRGQPGCWQTGYWVLVEKFSIIKVAEILAMCIKLHFVQLCKIWVKSENLDFSLFHGVPPLQIFWFFLHWHFMMKQLKFKGGTPWKSEKWRVSDLTQILHSCTKCNFMHIAKISATFVIENFTTSTNNRSVNIQVLPF